MAVKLRKKSKPPSVPSHSTRKSRSAAFSKAVRDALLTVLMYFPHQKMRALAADALDGYVADAMSAIRKIVKAIEDSDKDVLEEDGNAVRVFRALKTLKQYADTRGVKPRASARARIRPRKVGRLTKCR